MDATQSIDSLTIVHTTYTLFGIVPNLQVYYSSTAGKMGMYITVHQLVRWAIMSTLLGPGIEDCIY